MAERAGIKLDSGHFPRRMSDEMGAILTKRLQFALREKPAVGEYDKQRFDGVALALDVSVASGVVNRVRRNAQNAVVKHIQNIYARETAAGVAGTGVLDVL